jgi:hypothetical protein
MIYLICTPPSTTIKIIKQNKTKQARPGYMPVIPDMWEIEEGCLWPQAKNVKPYLKIN